MKTIYHPKTKKISATIEKLSEPTIWGDHYKITVFQYTEWMETYEDAVQEANDLMDYIYSGKEADDIMEWREQVRLSGGY